MNNGTALGTYYLNKRSIRWRNTKRGSQQRHPKKFILPDNFFMYINKHTNIYKTKAKCFVSFLSRENNRLICGGVIALRMFWSRFPMTFKIGADKGAHSVLVLLDPTDVDRNFITYVIAGMYFCYFAPFLLSMVSLRVVFLAHFLSTFFPPFCMPLCHSELTTLLNFRYLKTKHTAIKERQSGVTNTGTIWISGQFSQRSLVREKNDKTL